MPQNATYTSTNLHNCTYSTMDKTQSRHIKYLRDEFDIMSIIIWSCQWTKAKSGLISLFDFISQWTFHGTNIHSIQKYIAIPPKIFINHLYRKRSCLKPLEPRKTLKGGLSSIVHLLFDGDDPNNHGTSLHFYDCNSLFPFSNNKYNI